MGAHVTALEPRPANLCRTILNAHYWDVQDQVSVRLADTSELERVEVDEFELLFHAGVLYHVPDPARHLRAVAPLCRWMFLDTHVADLPKPHLSEEVECDGVAGRWYREGGWGDPLSGVGDNSFWMMRASLLQTLDSCGLQIIEIIDEEGDHNGCGQRIRLLTERR